MNKPRNSSTSSKASNDTKVRLFALYIQGKYCSKVFIFHKTIKIFFFLFIVVNKILVRDLLDII